MVRVNIIVSAGRNDLGMGFPRHGNALRPVAGSENFRFGEWATFFIFKVQQYGHECGNWHEDEIVVLVHHARPAELSAASSPTARKPAITAAWSSETKPQSDDV
jgi:hypothetical protein